MGSDNRRRKAEREDDLERVEAEARRRGEVVGALAFEVRCACGKLLRTVSATPGQSAAALVTRYEEKPRLIHCPCGRTNAMGGTPAGAHEPHVVVRGEGGIDVGRGLLHQLRRLCVEHMARGGRFGPPAKRKPVDRRDPPGTVTVQTPAGPVKVPPGQVVEVHGVVIDTRDGRVSFRPVDTGKPRQ